MKKFLGMAIIALSMVLASCGVTGGGVDNAPVYDDTNATINGRHYDNETEKCWKVDTWQKTVYSHSPEDNTNETETYYEWGTEYEIRKSWENWKAAANVSINAGWGITATSTGDFTMTELVGRTDATCYETFGN